MKKWKEKLIHMLGGYASPIEVQSYKIITSTAPLIRLKVNYTFDPIFQDALDDRIIKRELAEKLVDNMIDNHMIMIDKDNNEITATVYVADVRKVG